MENEGLGWAAADNQDRQPWSPPRATRTPHGFLGTAKLTAPADYAALSCEYVYGQVHGRSDAYHQARDIIEHGLEVFSEADNLAMQEAAERAALKAARAARRKAKAEFDKKAEAHARTYGYYRG